MISRRITTNRPERRKFAMPVPASTQSRLGGQAFVFLLRRWRRCERDVAKQRVRNEGHQRATAGQTLRIVRPPDRYRFARRWQTGRPLVVPDGFGPGSGRYRAPRSEHISDCGGAKGGKRPLDAAPAGRVLLVPALADLVRALPSAGPVIRIRQRKARPSPRRSQPLAGWRYSPSRIRVGVCRGHQRVCQPAYVNPPLACWRVCCGAFAR